MKRLGFVGTLLLLGALQATAQYPLLTIRQIQEVSIDSLNLLDTLQRSQLSRWTAQTSLYFHDTVRVRGVCVVPARVIGFTASGYNLTPAQIGALVAIFGHCADFLGDFADGILGPAAVVRLLL